MSALHALDVRARTTVFGLLVMMLMVVDHPAWNGLLLAGLLVCLLVTRAPLLGTLATLRPLMTLFLFVAVFALFGPPRFHHPQHGAVLFSLWGLDATVGGLLVGIDFVIRIVALVVLTAAYLSATSTDEMLVALDRVRAPYWLGILLTTALSFVPTMTRRKDLIRDAQRARGADLGGRGPIGHIAAFVPIMVPLLTSAILMADNLSVALTNRGYGASRRMTALQDLRWRGRDTVVCLLAAAGCAAWTWARFALGLGQV